MYKAIFDVLQDKYCNVSKTIYLFIIHTSSILHELSIWEYSEAVETILSR